MNLRSGRHILIVTAVLLVLNDQVRWQSHAVVICGWLLDQSKVADSLESGLDPSAKLLKLPAKVPNIVLPICTVQVVHS